MKKIILLFLSLLLTFTLVGCNPESEPVKPVEPGQEEEPVEQTQDVVLYFGNNEYILSGDENLDPMLTENRTIVYGPEMSLEEAIIRELMAGPEDTERMSTSFKNTVELIGVETSDGTAYVDFKGENLSGSSMEEGYIIDQTVASLGELDYIDRVQFLIDGEKAESLMGHIAIDQAIEVEK